MTEHSLLSGISWINERAVTVASTVCYSNTSASRSFIPHQSKSAVGGINGHEREKLQVAFGLLFGQVTA